MTLFDDKPPDSPEPEHTEQDSRIPASRGPISAENSGPPLAGDPISYAAAAHPPCTSSFTPRPSVPEDLRISWSWSHFFVFIFYALSSFFLVQIALIIYYATHTSLPPRELERYLLNKP